MVMRRRGVLLKLLVALPSLWLVATLVTLSDKPDKDAAVAGGGGGPMELPPVVRLRDSNNQHQQQQQQPPPPQPPQPPPSPPLPPHQQPDLKPEVIKTKTEEPHEVHPEQGVLLPPHEPSGPGEMGKPVVLPKDLDPAIKKKVDEGWKNNAFNQYVSDMISVHRTLPDPRDEWCKAPNRFLDNLPETSVIVCFHNEAWSVLLRTVHSILDRSPPQFLKEIILVDDNSDMPHLMQQLEDYMAQYPKVRIVRAPKREGLIRARLMGARHATAPVLTFLDSHCECTAGWLEPLLARIAHNSQTVVCPVIDVVSDDTLEYHYRDSSGVNVGGFDWSLQV
ncbi:hypothetical protein Pmani_004838 [Petrolisthes manimaculis]|uniref:Glycosyltransferase 2-like domain-containing protein n=1 Tax=Petrolisthes manimaculis TaxID=1843537 RepID=A0AAE1QCX3_9EUCA|nr:hypothetical protein Pmani_004838 [Petrolisthes manimaculis]